jgi:hypothetical protein
MHAHAYAHVVKIKYLGRHINERIHMVAFILPCRVLNLANADLHNTSSRNLNLTLDVGLL